MTTKQRETYESALRTLEGGNFEVKELWRELTRRVEDHERGVIDPDDLPYHVPSVPPSIVDMFGDAGDGMVVSTAGVAVIPGRNGQDRLPACLAPHLLWKGYHYTLTPGQRKWFRESAGMPPSRTVTIQWLEVWPGTDHPRSFRVESDVHVDPRHRAHVIREFHVKNAGRFFREAQVYDNEEAKPVKFVLNSLTANVGGYYILTSEQKWAVEDLVDVKMKKDCQITKLSDTAITFEWFEEKQACRVTVAREEFFRHAEELTALYLKQGQPQFHGKRKKKEKPPEFASVDDLLANLGSVL